MSRLFPPGQVVTTPGALQAMEDAGNSPYGFLQRHLRGDWGDVCDDDRKENDLSVEQGFRILSSYKTAKGKTIWLITEADRSATTFLLPEEY